MEKGKTERAKEGDGACVQNELYSCSQCQWCKAVLNRDKGADRTKTKGFRTIFLLLRSSFEYFLWLCFVSCIPSFLVLPCSLLTPLPVCVFIKSVNLLLCCVPEFFSFVFCSCLSLCLHFWVLPPHRTSKPLGGCKQVILEQDFYHMSLCQEV